MSQESVQFSRQGELSVATVGIKSRAIMMVFTDAREVDKMITSHTWQGLVMIGFVRDMEESEKHQKDIWILNLTRNTGAFHSRNIEFKILTMYSFRKFQ